MIPSDVQVMLDLETLAQSPNAVICSIGAVKFTLAEGITDTFYCTVDAKDCKKYGMVVEEQTINWWKKQPREVMAELLKDTIPLKDALVEFSKWFGTKSLPTWSCGASFDLPIIQWAYSATDMRAPARHWDHRCYSTMKELFKEVPLPEFVGDKHNALADAKHQTNHLIAILKS
jgi:exodeoxyribonuclease VIII